MRKTGLLLLVALGLLVAAGASAQSAPIWNVDNPRDGDRVSGWVLLNGFFLEEEGWTRVDLYVNGEFRGSADTGLPRVDVTEVYPQYEGTQGANLPGFTVGFSTREVPNNTALSVFLRITRNDDAGSTFDTDPITLVVDQSINQPPFGAIDSPKDGDSMTGPFPVYGWALDGDGAVDKVEVMVDGQIYGSGVLGDDRVDVCNAFDQTPGCGGAGWIMYLDSNRLEPGQHQLKARLTDNEGMMRIIGPIDFQTFNVGTNNVPFGRIDYPNDNAVWQSVQCADNFVCPVSPCTEFEILEDVYFISGWALDTAHYSDDGGVRYGQVSYVEMYVDGALIWNTDLDCMVLGTEFPQVPPPLDDTYVNCYGYYRPDVNMMYPGFETSEKAGWMFVIDVYSQLLEVGYRPGVHTIKIRVGDEDEGAAIIDELEFELTCPVHVLDYATMGYIDFPTDYEYVNGTVRTFGWVVDRDLVSRIDVYVDGVNMGRANYGFERKDVIPAFPNYPVSITQYSGWVFDLDTTLLGDGEHDFWLLVYDAHTPSQVREIGKRRIVVDNPQP
jgi:hypothetical protein